MIIGGLCAGSLAVGCQPAKLVTRVRVPPGALYLTPSNSYIPDVVMSITCEICGRPVQKKKLYRYEGLTLILCPICARNVNAIEVPEKKVVSYERHQQSQKRISKPPSKIPEELTYELVQDYGRKIREAREKLGLERDKLARRLGISESLLRKIEMEKLSPDLALARRLEKILHIRILRKIDLELLEIISKAHHEKSKPLTLGDVIIIERPRKRKKK